MTFAFFILSFIIIIIIILLLFVCLFYVVNKELSSKGVLPVDKTTKTMHGVCSILGADKISQGDTMRLIGGATH